MLNMPQSGPQLTPEVRHGANTPYSNVSQPVQNVNGNPNQQVQNNLASRLPSILELSSETLREWLQAAGNTGDSLSALQNLYAHNGMTPEKASQTVLQNLLNRYAGAFQNGTDGVTAQAIAEAAERDRLERTVAGENARYNGTAEALVEAALRLPWDTEARNLAEQATVARQAEILGKLEELEAAKKQGGAIQTSEQLLEFTRTIGRLERELEALEQGRLSDRLDSETLGRLAEAVQDGQQNQIANIIASQTAGTEQQKPQLATAWESGKLTEEGIGGKVNLKGESQSDNLGQLSAVLQNGYADAEVISKNASIFENQSETRLVEYLNSVGYLTHTQGSKYPQSRARIIKIQNPGGDLNISQIQISPGGGRHGINPYMKISTTTQGVIKIIFGDPNTYETDGKETATLIFTGGTRHD